MSTKPNTCQKFVSGWPSKAHACGRELRTPEQVEAGLCGPHLAGKRRSEKVRADRSLRNREDRERSDRASALAAELSGLGLKSALPHWDWRRNAYTGQVVLGGQDAAAVIRALREGRGKDS